MNKIKINNTSNTFQKITCNINQNEKKIIIEGLDVPGILSHIVGIISLQGIEIQKATSFSYIKEEKNYFKDEFEIDFIHLEKETWYKDLPKLIENQTKLIYNQKRAEATKKIIEYIVEFFVREKDLYNKIPVIEIQILKLNNIKQLKIIVEGEDTPFLLYVLSNAIESQGIPILEFSINTNKQYITDAFILDISNKPNLDLTNLRLVLIFNVQFTYFLNNSPDPYNAFLRFQEIIKTFQKDHRVKDIQNFLTQSDTKQLAALLGTSDFLWEDFVRVHAKEIERFFLEPSISKELDTIEHTSFKYEKELKNKLKHINSYKEQISILNSFKDEKIFFADIYNIMNENQDVKKLSIRLSEIAKITIRQATVIIEKKITKQYGVPESSAGQKSDWALFALGKLGGSALGYASDIELMFIYEDAGNTTGNKEESISNSAYFELFIKEINKVIITTREGIFKVDLRLRPYGEAGPMAVRLSNFIDYYQSDKAHSIEKLALTRMRPIAGNPRLAERTLRIMRSILYQENSLDVLSIFEMRKNQIIEKVRDKTRNAKFSKGALADVEYSVQILQVLYGKNNIDLQQPSIHNSLQALYNIGEITAEESSFLVEAYMFFRQLINALRMRRGNAKDVTLPAEDSWELEHLARRMGYISKDLSAGEQLIFDYDRISAQANNFIASHFKYIQQKTTAKTTNPAEIVFVKNHEQVSWLLRHFDDPQRAFESIKVCGRNKDIKKLFSQLLLLAWIRIIRRGEANLVLLNFEKLVEKFNDDKLKNFYEKLLKKPKELSIIIDIFATSRFLSDEIIKNTNYLFYLIELKNLQKKKEEKEFYDDFEVFEKEQLVKKEKKKDLNKKNIIREFRKREILRIMTRDVCIKAPLEHICTEISFLASTIIKKAYEYVVEQRNIDIQGISIFAFGKLGSQELNYSSDLDLLCVYDNTCNMSLNEIRSLFKDCIKCLTDYTSKGQAYRVDLRLRPFGNSGDIVSKIQTIENYYKNYARLWEIQAALKLSCVAGDETLADKCYQIILKQTKNKISEYMEHKKILEEIHNLRKISVNQYSSKTDNDLYEIKHTRGGIRDIEFSVQALLLLHYTEHKKNYSTLSVLEDLYRKNIINQKTYDSQYENYLFLRKVEHFLQVYEDKQMHTISKNNSTVIKRLAWLLLEEQDEDVFLQKLKKTKNQVHAWYKKIFE